MKSKLLVASVVLVVSWLSPCPNASAVELWGRWEHELLAETLEKPQAVTLSVQLAGPDGKSRTVDGFWDGGKRFKVRFQPSAVGTWRFRSESTPAVPGLDGVSGTFECTASSGKSRFAVHGAIRVAENGRHFEHADGTPFFWFVDTAWNGALKSRAADWERYLTDRTSKHFTGVQFVTTQWRTAYTDAEGRVAYRGFESIDIEPEFYQRLDARMDAVNDHGLLAVPVLLWTLGDRSYSPGQLPEREAIRLARYQVARYGAHHVAWFLPGDGKYFDDTAERWKRIGRAVFDHPHHAPVFLHPQGMQWPYDGFREETWLSALGYQSGHGDDARTLQWIFAGPPARRWNIEPARPVINLEPPYEDHIAYQSRKPHTAYNVRRAICWSLLNAPTAGVSYGAHGVWSWEESGGEPLNHKGTGVAKPWYEAMALPGSRQLGDLVQLLESLRWWELRPDPELATADLDANDPAVHVSASRSDPGDLALVYLPRGGSVTLRAGRLQKDLRSLWFDLRSGKTQPAAHDAHGSYRAPDENDWLLVLRDEN